MYILRRHWDLVVSANQIEDREDSGVAGGLGEGVDVGKRISVIPGNHVERPVIAARAPSSIRLRHNM